MNIALLPGGFKPPHLGHYNMAKYLADFADKVIVRIGQKEREGIGPELALKVWNFYKEFDPDSKAKKLIISVAQSPSPVKDVYDFVEKIAPEGSTVILGLGEKDAADGRYNSIPKFAEPRNIKADIELVPAQAGGISGTRMREIIKSNNKNEFFKYIPEFLPEEIKEEIWTELVDSTMPTDIDEMMAGTMNREEMAKHNANMKKLRKFFSKQGDQMYQIPTNLTKGLRRKLYEGSKYDEGTVKIQRLIFTEFKDQLGKSFKNREWSEYWLEGPEYVIFFDIGVEFMPKKMLIPYSIEGDAGEDDIQIKITYNPESFPESFNDLNAEIKETVRHELEHLAQYNFPNKESFERFKGKIPFYKYLTLNHETPAFVRGLNKRAKFKKISLSDAFEEFFDDFIDQFKSEDEINTVRQTWTNYAQENLPGVRLNENLTEVGEGTAKPFFYTLSKRGFPDNGPDAFTYDVWGEANGEELEMFVAADWEDSHQGWEISFGVNNKTMSTVINGGKDFVYRMMATIKAILLEEIQKRNIKRIIFTPSEKDPGSGTGSDPRRARLYMQYITKTLPNATLNMELSNEGDGFYVIDFEKPENVNENIDLKDFTYFETGQGSKYIRKNSGQLRRIKSHHDNTGGSDKGLKNWKQQSMFVDPKYYNTLMGYRTLDSKGVNFIDIAKTGPNKMAFIIIKDDKKTVAKVDDVYPKTVQINPKLAGQPLEWEFSIKPTMGYHVVDWNPTNNGVKSFHVGSPVSKIGDLSNKDAKIFFGVKENFPPYKANQVQQTRYKASDTFTNDRKKAKKMGYLQEKGLSSKEKAVVDDILGELNDLQEIDLNKIKEKLKYYGRKGMLTLSILLAVANGLQASPNIARDVIDTGIEMVDTNSKEDFYNSIIGYAAVALDGEMGSGGDIYLIGALKEVKLHYEALRNNETPRPLSDHGKKALNAVMKELSKTSFDTIEKYIEIGAGTTTSYYEGKDPKVGTGKKPKGSGRRLYTDENPKDTVSIKFSTRQDIVDTLSKKSFKAKSHARQSQIINLIHQRVRAAYGRAKDPAVKKRLKSALDYITKRKEASKRKTKRIRKEGVFSKDWWLDIITEEILYEGGAAGHMAHPFDLPQVKTGRDLIKSFEQAADSLEKQPGSVKIDGVNASIRLINNAGKRQFAMDRGSKKALDLKGVTKDDLEARFGAGHGMIKAGGDVLDIFNAALPTIEEELTALGLWDDPNVMFNMEYVSGKSNVQDYGKNFLAIHGLLSVETKEVQGARKMLTKRITSEKGFAQSDMDELLKKLEPFAKKKGFEIYGSVPTTFTKKPDFKSVLGKSYKIEFAEGAKVKSLAQWLNDVTSIPAEDRIQMNLETGGTKDVGALSKQVYFAIFGGETVDDLFDNEQDIQKAIQGAITYLATEKLGDAILDVLDSPMGSVNDHEGVVIRDPKISNRPFKITGKFITGGVSSQFQSK